MLEIFVHNSSKEICKRYDKNKGIIKLLEALEANYQQKLLFFTSIMISQFKSCDIYGCSKLSLIFGLNKGYHWKLINSYMQEFSINSKS
ncbi:hypothetical protein BpHYR1_019329 [Brachionus plicatilis]|uniref:Uncharacterized protein n=1 Tax=Brachionus plicatilis TaxID=10195 RepID=A0A3M7QLM3_BRAPC|nr:hypothetical protein BpHYR1_019329 [Brachionus plicatilis]